MEPTVVFGKTPFLQTIKGKLTILGVIILLLLLALLILNYFTSTISFLPHKQSPQSSPLSDQNNVPDQVKLAVDFLSIILAPSLAPSLSQINITSDRTNDTLTITWQTHEGTAAAVFTINNTHNNTQTISSLHLTIPTDEVSPSAELAQKLSLPLFSITPKGDWACKPLRDLTYCENFWQEESNVKRGIGLYGPVIFNNKSVTIIFFCQQSKQAQFYHWQSCTTEFAETGVK